MADLVTYQLSFPMRISEGIDTGLFKLPLRTSYQHLHSMDSTLHLLCLWRCIRGGLSLKMHAPVAKDFLRPVRACGKSERTTFGVATAMPDVTKRIEGWLC